MQQGYAAGSSYLVEHFPAILGRGKEADVRLGDDPSDPTLSRRHARLSLGGGRLSVQDLSTNGTSLGQRLLRADEVVSLQDREELWLGPRTCMLVETLRLGLALLAVLSLLWLGWHRPAEVRVLTTPQGARVLVNDVPRGLSPLTLTVARGTRLRVELDGYQPVSDVLDFEAPGGEIHLQLLPGPVPSSHAGSVWAPAPGTMTEPSFYPALWGPPPTLRPRLDHQVAGFAFGVPAGWSVVEEGPQQVVLAGGDGRNAPRRSATLTVTRSGS